MTTSLDRYIEIRQRLAKQLNYVDGKGLLASEILYEIRRVSSFYNQMYFTLDLTYSISALELCEQMLLEQAKAKCDPTVGAKMRGDLK